MTQTLLLAQTLRFSGNPFLDGLEAARHERRGAVLVEGGKIGAVGAADDLRRAGAHLHAEADGLFKREAASAAARQMMDACSPSHL